MTNTANIVLFDGSISVVSAIDLPSIQHLRWYAYRDGRTCYARARVKLEAGVWGVALLHRMILGALPGQLVDHRDGDGLNNCRENLRLCTNGQNMANKRRPWGASKYKGVFYDGRSKCWRACVTVNGQRNYLGRFGSEIEAAAAYDAAALTAFGDFAAVNQQIYPDDFAKAA